jgi:ABC-type antimicrobial peptide transport system permease subunit
MARLIYGFRISVLFGLVLTILSSAIGILAGALQGYFGGALDLLFQRFMEIWSSLPVLYLLIILASIITPSFWTLLGIMLLFSWMALVGLVRAEFLRARNFDYVRAARALGVSDAVLMFRHILPNAMVSSLTYLPFILAGSVTTLTSLDFLGFGLPPGSPSLGELLLQGKNNLNAPWLALTGFFVMIPVPCRIPARCWRSAISASISAPDPPPCTQSARHRSPSSAAKPWPWSASRGRASPSQPCRSCSCSPIRWHATPAAASAFADRSLSARRRTCCAPCVAIALR